MNAQPPPPPPPPPPPQEPSPSPPQRPAGGIPAYRGVSDDTPGGGSGKASGGLRVLAAVGVVVLLFATAVLFIAFGEISGLTPCDDVSSSADLNSDGECYDGSSATKIITVVLGFLGAALAAVATFLCLAFVIRGRGARPLLYAVGGAVVLTGLAFAIG